MAHVVGESGAWREIANDLGRRGMRVEKPSDISPLLKHLRETFQPSVNERKAEIAIHVADNEGRIKGLRAETGLFRTTLNWLRVQVYKLANAKLRREESRYIATLSSNIDTLEYMQVSSELAGAQAEIEVIAQLTRLSNRHTVISGVVLHAKRHIQFNGSTLQSAQIDHLVLSPSGIFVVETKRWSKDFVATGDYHDPFDQVCRAAYLCYDLIKEVHGVVRVRSIIANAGHLPPLPRDSYVKVLPIVDLDMYISRFEKEELNPDELSSLRHYFDQHIIT